MAAMNGVGAGAMWPRVGRRRAFTVALAFICAICPVSPGAAADREVVQRLNVRKGRSLAETKAAEHHARPRLLASLSRLRRGPNSESTFLHASNPLCIFLASCAARVLRPCDGSTGLVLSQALRGGGPRAARREDTHDSSSWEEGARISDDGRLGEKTFGSSEPQLEDTTSAQDNIESERAGAKSDGQEKDIQKDSIAGDGGVGKESGGRGADWVNAQLAQQIQQGMTDLKGDKHSRKAARSRAGRASESDDLSSAAGRAKEEADFSGSNFEPSSDMVRALQDLSDTSESKEDALASSPEPSSNAGEVQLLCALSVCVHACVCMPFYSFVPFYSADVCACPRIPLSSLRSCTTSSRPLRTSHSFYYLPSLLVTTSRVRFICQSLFWGMNF